MGKDRTPASPLQPRRLRWTYPDAVEVAACCTALFLLPWQTASRVVVPHVLRARRGIRLAESAVPPCSMLDGALSPLAFGSAAAAKATTPRRGRQQRGGTAANAEGGKGAGGGSAATRKPAPSNSTPERRSWLDPEGANAPLNPDAPVRLERLPVQSCPAGGQRVTIQCSVLSTGLAPQCILAVCC